MAQLWPENVCPYMGIRYKFITLPIFFKEPTIGTFELFNLIVPKFQLAFPLQSQNYRMKFSESM